MTEKSIVDDAQVQQSFRVCRNEIQHEYGVLATRLNSYITSQAFLVPGYAVSMGNANPYWGPTFSLYFPLLLCLVGGLLTVRAHPGISGVCTIITEWHKRQDDLFDTGADLDDYVVLKRQSVRGIHDSNLYFAQTSTWIFGLAWFLMAILAIYLHVSVQSGVQIAPTISTH